MKIAVLTSGRLPVPAVQGGAVENLIDFYLEYNDVHHLHDITVYSIKQDVRKHPDTDCNHYHYVDVKSYTAKIAKKVYSVFNKSPYYDSEIECFLYKSLQHLKHQHYDCVILENRPGYAMSVKKVTNAPIILHLHNDLLNNDTFRSREIYSCLSKVITVSNYIKNCVETLGTGIPVVTVYNGIDLKRFNCKSEKPLVKREDLGLKEDDFVVVYSGRLTKEKGIKELLQAFLSLKDYPSIKLLVIGGSFYGNNTSEISPFIKELQSIADEMSGKIVFTGFISYDDMPDYLSLADIAAIPSMWDDPFPTTVLEAMAVGLPIIATKSGGIPESCGECAFIVDRDNVVSLLSESLMNLYSNKVRRIQMSKGGIIKSKQYDKVRYASDFYQQLL